jgi:hypothetical protein
MIFFGCLVLGHKICWPNRRISWKRGHIVRRNSAGGRRLSSNLDGGRTPIPNSCCVQASASVALPAPIGEEQTGTVAGSVLSVRGRARAACNRWGRRPTSGGIAVEKLSAVELLEGSWRTALNHSRPASCISDADIDAEDYPERDPQKGH